MTALNTLRSEVVTVRNELTALSNKYTEDRVLQASTLTKLNSAKENLTQNVGRLQTDSGSRWN